MRAQELCETHSEFSVVDDINMSAPRIKFKDEIEIGIASIDDKISASPKSSSKYMNHNLINTNDLPFVDSSLKSRR